MNMKVPGMKGIGTLATNKLETAQNNAFSYLLIEKLLIEDRFSWLQCHIKDTTLIGEGILWIKGKKYRVAILYSYFLPRRFDRIWIKDPHITFHPDTHMYSDSTLCLYHPDDLSIRVLTPLATMIPWIGEWLIKYEFWKKYAVWIGDEAPH